MNDNNKLFWVSSEEWLWTSRAAELHIGLIGG
jgi:hypothetical protein